MKYSIEEGLPTSNIYSVIEDANGYMWFATDVGVLRYDGYQFIHFNTDDGLGDNEVFEIFEDSSGKLWFLSLNGKLSFYRAGEFQNATNNNLIGGLSHADITMDVHEGEDGSLFFLFGDGMLTSLEPDGTISKTDYNDTKAYAYWRIDNRPFILGREYILDLTTRDSITVHKENFTDGSYRSCVGNENNYYFSGSTTVYEFKGGKNFEVFYNLPAPYYDIINLSLWEDDLWMGTRTGLLKLNDGAIKSFFKDDIVSSILKDSQDNYWVTTLNDGIKFIPNLNVTSPSLYDENPRVNSLEKDKDNVLWIGTDKGIYKIEPGNPLPFELPQFRDRKIKNIRNFDDKMIFMGREMLVYNDTKWTTYAFTSNDLLLSNDTIFFANSNYTGMMSEKRFNNIINNQKPKISKETIRGAILNKRSNVVVLGKNHAYIGTTTGLYRKESDKVIKTTTFNGELETSILDLHYDALRDRLFVGSNSKGLVVLKNDAVEHHISTADGLNSNGINSIVPFEYNSYLVGTNKGLNVVTIEDDSVSISDYNVILKCKAERINDIEVVNDIVYLATDSGLQYFNPSMLTANSTRPILNLDKITVNGESHKIDGALTYNENTISVYYTGISFQDYGSLQYEYKLNEENYWTPTQIRQIEFKNLPHGDYNLQIRALSSNGNHSEVKELQFKITPPFWKTIPFIVGVILLGAIILYFIISRIIKTLKQRFELERRSLRTEREKTELEKKTIELEQKALRLQMNPHFIFNTLNTIKGFYSGGDIKDANLYISRFSKLLRLILENDMHLVSLETEIEMLELYIKLIQLRYQDVFEYNITIDNGIVTSETAIPPMLLQPIVENAIIHGLAPAGRKGQLNVSFFMEEDKLTCKVQDNGVGVKTMNGIKHSNHESKGISITRERVKFFNESSDDVNFQVTSNLKSPGTEVRIRIPKIKYW